MFNETECFPTPRRIAHKMLAKIDAHAVNFLEPSAGTGALVEAILGSDMDDYDRTRKNWERSHRKVDCIEIEPDLAALLAGKSFPVVGYDWLTYTGISYYDAIVMNPPFSNGDDHLLKAWEFLHDGEIVCLLNEETIKNPHTATRQKLAGIIAQHGSVEYLGDCFKDSKRPTGVNVAMVYLKKKSDDDRIEVWATAKEEKKPDDAIGPEDAMLAIKDDLGNMEHYYNMANENMLKGFAYLRKAQLYMDANHISSRGGNEHNYGKICEMALDNTNAARAEFARKHRRDAWFQVFEKMQFHKWLDKKQREQLLRDVERDSNIPFTADNIKGTLENVMLQRRRLFEQSVANVFDELTSHYKGNASSEGWKTNDNYKVNEKLIFPYGCSFDDKYFEKFELRYDGVIDIYNDLDRVLAVLDGVNFEEILTIGTALRYKFESYGDKYRTGRGGRYSTGNNSCHSTYFDIKFWKKGTVHLKFRDKELWEKFNVTAAAGRKWVGQNTNERSEWPGRRTTTSSTRRSSARPDVQPEEQTPDEEPADETSQESQAIASQIAPERLPDAPTISTSTAPSITLGEACTLFD